MKKILFSLVVALVLPFTVLINSGCSNNTPARAQTPPPAATATPTVTATTVVTVTVTVTPTSTDDIGYIITGVTGAGVNETDIGGYVGSTPAVATSGGTLPLTIGPYSSFSAGDSVSISAYYASAVTAVLNVSAFRVSGGSTVILGTGTSATGTSSSPAEYDAVLTQ